MERRIRNSAKGLIIKDGKMLATKIKDGEDVFYIMPGGGQETGETLEEAVEREVMEEFGYKVKAKSLEFVIEGLRGESFHRVDLVFLCDFIKEIDGAEITGDQNQVGYEWLSIDNLMNEELYPSKLRNQIINLYKGEKTTVYLGDESMEEPVKDKELENDNILRDGFKQFLRNRGLKESSIKDDLSRLNMMKKRNIDYTKGKEYAREILNISDLSHSTIVSCLRVCRYYKEFLDSNIFDDICDKN